MEYSGEDDFDQINVQPIPGSTNNQNGRFQFNGSSTARTGVGVADAAMGLFDTYSELGQRALTKWRSLGTDIFVQDSWKPSSNLTIEGGVRYVLWPPWYSTTNNIANFDPSAYTTTNQAVINPANGQIISGPRYNGIVLPGNGFLASASNLAGLYQPGGPRALQWRTARIRRDAQERVRTSRGRLVRVERQDDHSVERGRVPQPRDAERLAAARRQSAIPAAGRRQQRFG